MVTDKRRYFGESILSLNGGRREERRKIEARNAANARENDQADEGTMRDGRGALCSARFRFSGLSATRKGGSGRKEDRGKIRARAREKKCRADTGS